MDSGKTADAFSEIIKDHINNYIKEHLKIYINYQAPSSLFNGKITAELRLDGEVIDKCEQKLSANYF